MKTSHSKSAFHIVTLISLFIALIGGAVTATPAHAAATFTVNSTVDAVDAAPGNGVCATAGSVCTLRAAIQEANALAGDDTITLPAGTYTLTIAGTGEDAAATGDLDITSNITINGAGASSTIIDGGALDRVFHVTGVWAYTMNLSGVTVRNGNSGSSDGGGIWNAGTLSITNSVFSGNSIGGYGGGIENHGALNIANSTFSNNSAGGGGGGGIETGGGTMTITNSTFSGNSTSGNGGGIRIGGGTAIITNSTFSGNSATSGGGIYRNIGAVTLRNTIVANSTTGGDCGGTVTDGGNNIVEDNTCGFTGGADPNLGALTGSPAYFPLNAGSPAIDAGDDTVCANPPVNNESQNGATRPVGTHCDIGSFESGGAIIVNSQAHSTASGDGHCTLTEAIQNANNNAATSADCNTGAGADTITFSLSGAFTVTSAQVIADTAGLTIDGTGQTVNINGNHATQVMQVNSGVPLTLNNLTIANGNSSSDGGGIYNAGTLTITNSVFSGNAGVETGGGIYNAGTLTTTNSAFSGNSAAGKGGGGILNSGIATITNSTFSGNSATGGSGGGIDNYGTLTITNSTFSANSATGGGGGIYNNSGTATITNSTLSGNSSAAGGSGGGIGNDTGTLTLRNTIVANSASGGDCSGTVADGGNNIVEDNTCGFTGGADPNLGALTGSPAYFPLNAGSPAIDAGNDAVCAAAPVNNESQNGLTRPQGMHCDIGAVEALRFLIYLPLVIR